MMFKRINLLGIIILVVILLVFQLGFGLVISPALKTVIVDKINENSGSKIEIENAHIWPLTLSVTLKGLKVYDPKNNERIVEIGKASVRLSFIALLSKRIVLSAVRVDGAEIFLKREPDGSFNIQQLGESKEEAKEEARRISILERLRGKQDWFGRVYDAFKKKASKKAAEEKEKERKEARKVTREVTELPKGRVVKFKTVRDDYLFEIRDLKIKDTLIHMEAENKETIDVERAGIRMRNLAIDPKRGARFDGLSIKGALRKKDNPAGSFSLNYAQSYRRDTLKTHFDITAKDIDMAAINFIYDDSLPVVVKKGMLDLRSRTDVVNGEMDSENSLLLRNQYLEAKRGQQVTVGFIPTNILIDALNKIDPIDLKFDITGTVENPKFSGFQDSLLNMVKPYVEDIKEQGIKAVGSFIKEKIGIGEESGEPSADTEGGTAQKAIDSIKSLFKKE